MGSLLFACPKSGRKIDIGIDTDPNSLSVIQLFRVRGHCPICDEIHEWDVADGRIRECRAA